MAFFVQSDYFRKSGVQQNTRFTVPVDITTETSKAYYLAKHWNETTFLFRDIPQNFKSILLSEALKRGSSPSSSSSSSYFKSILLSEALKRQTAWQSPWRSSHFKSILLSEALKPTWRGGLVRYHFHFKSILLSEALKPTSVQLLQSVAAALQKHTT